MQVRDRRQEEGREWRGEKEDRGRGGSPVLWFPAISGYSLISY
jgi:hypothetical protein